MRSLGITSEWQSIIRPRSRRAHRGGGPPLADRGATEKIQEIIGMPENSQQLASRRAFRGELTSGAGHRNVSRVGGSRGKGPTAPAKEFRHDGTAYRHRRARRRALLKSSTAALALAALLGRPTACSRHALGRIGRPPRSTGSISLVDLRQYTQAEIDEIYRQAIGRDGGSSFKAVGYAGTRARAWPPLPSSSTPPAFFHASIPPPMGRAELSPASCAACTAIAERSPNAQ